MAQDPLGRDNGEELFLAIARLCDGHPASDVLAACANMLANVVRQHYGRRTEAEAIMGEIFGRTMSALMEHYDPTTNRRRSVVPFTQVIHASRVNGHS